MPPLKLLIPLLVILGLQAAVLTLPFFYWRLQTYMGPVNKFLLGSFLCASPFPSTAPSPPPPQNA